jgi:dienelactone hydrolase
MRFLPALLALSTLALAAPEPTLPGTQPLKADGDLSVQMVDGINRWLAGETDRATEQRAAKWKGADAAQPWDQFVESQRAKLRQCLGVLDERAKGRMERYEAAGAAADSSSLRVESVRWPVFEGVSGEGVLLLPKDPVAVVIVLPDPDDLEQQLSAPARLAAQGFAVLIPTLLDRQDTWSGSPAVGRFTNQPHREWIYRQAFELGRTAIGHEVQKVMASIDALLAPESGLSLAGKKIALAGFGEGGLIALHTAALDPRIAATMVGGYFGSHPRLYREPIYRNVFGLLRDFDNAELAALIHPRRLIIEFSNPALVSGPPKPEQGRAGAAPGVIEEVPFADVSAEVAHAHQLVVKHPGAAAAAKPAPIPLITAPGQKPVPAFAPDSFVALANALAVPLAAVKFADQSAQVKTMAAALHAQQERAVKELEGFTQKLLRAEERGRWDRIWKGLKAGPEWDKKQADLREALWTSIGKLPGDRLAPNPRSRIAQENPKWTAYDVMLDVRPDIFAWGWLLLPNDLQPGEKRPVVVCQHGLEGLPRDTVTEDKNDHAYGPYKGFAARLAEQGFIVYAPHNPYRGQDRFREINRRANPLALSLFSFINEQHAVTTDWLASLPFVDPERIGFYGLSYGGKSAMRIPALVPRYCLSICSGDFNEWVYKNAGTEYRSSYMFVHEYEIFEWNLGTNANYAEMALLIAPRPFMVERGHEDGVGSDEWVGYEYAKVRRGYTKLGIPERTAIEWFDGPHTINGQGTFDFLHQQLHWPKR